MDTNLQQRISEALRDPQNVGEMADADAVGTVGNADCGEMMRLWIKYKDDKGQQVIDKASFQSFGCETAIAVASIATQMLKGRTREQALSLSPIEIAADLGPLPPMKIHCAELVQAAVRAALTLPTTGGEKKSAFAVPSGLPSNAQTSNLLSNFAPPAPANPLKIVFLDPTRS